MKIAEKFDKWEKLWQDGKNEYLRRSYISTEILRTILLKGRKGKTLYRIIDSDDRLFYEGIVNLRITCTTSDIDKLMYIANGVGRKSAAIVEFSKDTLSYEMQKTDSKWTDESEHLTFGKFKVSKKSNEIYINGCDIPLIHFYAEPIDQSVDFAKKLIQKRIGHYRDDPLAKRLNDEAILKMFNESTNYNMSELFESILQEGWTEDQAAKTFEDYSKIRGYDAKEDLMQFAYYGSNSNFKHFAVNVAKLLPKECDLKIGQGGMAISVTYKGYGVGEAYRSVNDKEVHCFNIAKPVIRFGMKDGFLNTDGAAKRFINYLQPNIAKAEIKAQEYEAREIKRNANADRIKQVRPDAKDLQRARDAWGKLKGLGELRKYYDLWRQQNDKITDTAKADRRVNAFYNFFLSQEPNIPESYKPEFNRIKTRFENEMKDINLHESVNSKTVFDEILTEGWNQHSGYVPHDGNGMVGGRWSSADTSGEYEKEIEVELDGTYYLVYLTMDADLDQGYDDSVNYSWSDVNIDENSIQLKDMMRELSDEQDVTDPELRNKLFNLAKEKLLANPDKYFESDFEIDEPDYPDYEPDDF